jgi:hypothetical protein
MRVRSPSRRASRAAVQLLGNRTVEHLAEVAEVASEGMKLRGSPPGSPLEEL